MLWISTHQAEASGEEQRASENDEAGSDSVRQPAPEGVEEGVGAPVQHEHHPHVERVQVEQGQVTLQGRLSSNAVNPGVALQLVCKSHVCCKSARCSNWQSVSF